MVRAMEKLGHVTVLKGSRGRLRTAMEPTERLRATIARLGVSSPVERLPGAETIILKASTGRGRPKVLVEYDDTPQTAAMRAEMQTINDVFARADLKFDGQPLPPTFLTRRFQIESREDAHAFTRLGRLYGGYWMNVRKSERHLLTIDGEELADLDFTAMFLQLAYLRSGLPLPKGDPYDCGANLPRTAAKLALLAFLCASGGMKQLPWDVRPHLDGSCTIAGLVETLSSRHPGIAHLFGSGVGLDLMFTESRVLVRALLHLGDYNIPALPMHDGLMVAVSNAQAPRRAMEQAPEAELGVRLPIKRKAIRSPDRDNSPPMVLSGVPPGGGLKPGSKIKGRCSPTITGQCVEALL